MSDQNLFENIPIIGNQAKAEINSEIQRINSMPDQQKRIDAMIELKDKIRAEILDNLDDLLSQVDLGKKDYRK